MKPSSANNPPAADRPTAGSRGTRLLVPALALVLLGAGLAGVWFKIGKPASDRTRLSDNTRELLRHLESPVEIRFYSILPSGSAPESLQAFSGRVDHLLSEFQSAGTDKIHVIRNFSTEGANADAAAADGIRPFNLEKGDACFLGITVVSGGRKESLPRIQPEWEPALEIDLARVILQVTATSAVRPQSPPASPETTNVILRLIPDVRNTSLEDGTRILRAAAVQELTAAGTAAENQINLAKQQLANAQNSGSEQQQQTAAKHLQDVQVEQTEKVKAIAARLQEELAVFQQMKAAPPPAGGK